MRKAELMVFGGSWGRMREQFENIETFGSLLIGLQAQGMDKEIKEALIGGLKTLLERHGE